MVLFSLIWVHLPMGIHLGYKKSRQAAVVAFSQHLALQRGVFYMPALSNTGWVVSQGPKTGDKRLACFLGVLSKARAMAFSSAR